MQEHLILRQDPGISEIVSDWFCWGNYMVYKIKSDSCRIEPMP